MKEFIHKLIYPILLFAGFSISLPPFFKSLSLFLLLLVLVINLFVNKNQTYFSKILNFKNPVLYLAVFYLLYCIGMFYSTDLKEGFRDLIIKLPLIILPIVVALTPKRIITKKRLWKLFLAFALGLFVMQVYSLVSGLCNAFSAEGFDVKQILYTKLARKIHSTYFSLFTCVALLGFYLIPFKHLAKSAKNSMILKLAIMSWLAIFNVLLSSRIGIIAMFMALIVVLLNELAIRKRLFNTLAYLFVCLVFGVSFFVVNNANNRYENIVAKTQIAKESGNKIVDSVSQRSFIYKNVGQMIKKSSVFGVGTGDVKGELEEFYKEKGVDFGKYLNPHNQFIQVAFAIGILGFVCFIVMLISFSLGFWNKDSLIFLFAIGMLCVYMMSESIIERQQGVHFVAFFLTWLSIFKATKKGV
jgi:O-antigen ligase